MSRRRPLIIAAIAFAIAAFGAGAVLAADGDGGSDPVWIGGPIDVGAAGPRLDVFNPGTSAVDVHVDFIRSGGIVIGDGPVVSIPAGQSSNFNCACAPDTYMFKVTASGFVIPSATVQVAGGQPDHLFGDDFTYMGADGESPTASTVDGIAAVSTAIDSRTQALDTTTKALQSSNEALQAQVTQLQKQNKKILKKLKKLAHH
jgi:hypothetical protein